MSRSQPAESALIGREVDLLDLWRTLRTENVRLSGARRIGKTELLKHMRSDSRDGWTCLRIDLQGARDEPEAAGRAAQAFQGIGTAVDPRPSFAATLEQAIDRTVRRRRTKRLIVALDEVPWWLDRLRRLGGDEAPRTVLAQLRRIRQDDLLAPHLRMILTGSTGLAGLAIAVGATAELNDLSPKTLAPLRPKHGAELFIREAQGLGLRVSQEAALAAHDAAGGSPHWIKQIGQQLPRSAEDLGPDAVVLAIEALLAPPLRDLFEDDLRQHLFRRHPSRADLLMAILDAAAAGSDGAPQPALVAAALQARPGLDRRSAEEAICTLVDEFYLAGDDVWLRMANPLHQQWWAKYGRRR